MGVEARRSRARALTHAARTQSQQQSRSRRRTAMAATTCHDGALFVMRTPSCGVSAAMMTPTASGAGGGHVDEDLRRHKTVAMAGEAAEVNQNVCERASGWASDGPKACARDDGAQVRNYFCDVHRDGGVITRARPLIPRSTDAKNIGRSPRSTDANIGTHLYRPNHRPRCCKSRQTCSSSASASSSSVFLEKQARRHRRRLPPPSQCPAEGVEFKGCLDIAERPCRWVFFSNHLLNLAFYNEHAATGGSDFTFTDPRHHIQISYPVRLRACASCACAALASRTERSTPSATLHSPTAASSLGARRLATRPSSARYVSTIQSVRTISSASSSPFLRARPPSRLRRAR